MPSYLRTNRGKAWGRQKKYGRYAKAGIGAHAYLRSAGDSAIKTGRASFEGVMTILVPGIIIDGVVTLTTIPNLSVTEGFSISLAQYVSDPQGLVTDSQLLENGLPSTNPAISYSHDGGNYTLNGISPAVISNLQLQVIY
jgi:hypothetical protein